MVVSKYAQVINKCVLDQILKGEMVLSCEFNGRVWYISSYAAYSVTKDEAFVSGLPPYNPDSLAKMIAETDFSPEYLTDTRTEIRIGIRAKDVVKVFKTSDGEEILLSKKLIKPFSMCDFIGKYKTPWQSSIAVVYLGQIVGLVMPVNRKRDESV